MKELIALLDGRVMGAIVQGDQGRFAFTYAESWRAARGAYPLSLSMPLAGERHGHAAVEPFLWGLLPDNERVLDAWGRRFQVSSRNPFALLTHVGEDCAGAVQLVRPERLADIQSRGDPKDAGVEWLTEAEVAGRLRALRADAAAWRLRRDAGQFSLAGAQPKTALLFDGERWGVPSGRLPTTHILKPQASGFAGHAENEHLCLCLAHALGLPTAKTELRRFEDVVAVVVERYDRVRAQGRIYRAHQEDFCQALRVHPARKYQNEGGPGPKQIVELLRSHVAGAPRADGRTSTDEDVSTFLDALVLNWLIGGTDAHGKNYSILIGAGGLVRLAPLYDVASILAYRDVDPMKVKLAMKVGDAYRLRDVDLREWRKLATDLRVDGDRLQERLRAMAAELPDRLADEVGRIRRAGLAHPVIDTLAETLPARARAVVAG